MSLLGLRIGARESIAVMRVWVWFNIFFCFKLRIDQKGIMRWIGLVKWRAFLAKKDG